MRNIHGGNVLFLSRDGYRDTDFLIVKLNVLALLTLGAVINRHIKICNGSNKTGARVTA